MGLLDRIGKIVFGGGGAPAAPSYSPSPSYSDVNYTLTFSDGSSLVLYMSAKNYDLLIQRSKRFFIKRCPKDKLLSMINASRTFTELEDIAERYYICDTSDFSDLNLNAVKNTLCAAVDVLYEYPLLRSKLCYIGSAHGYRKKMESLKNGSLETLKDFGIEYICSPRQAVALGENMMRLADSYIADMDSYIALAIDAFGLFDALVLDADDYKGMKYHSTVSGLKWSEECGFHPKGCDSPESAVYHELGHLLDYLCRLYSNGMDRLFASYTASQINRELSQYASTNVYEFFAEAFAEAKCNPYPRPICRAAMDIFHKIYRRL